MKTSVEKFKPTASFNFESQNRKKLMGHYCLFNLSFFQRKWWNHWKFLLIKIWKSIAAHSNLEESFKCVVFEKDKQEYREVSILIAICLFRSLRIPLLMWRTNFLIFRINKAASIKMLSIAYFDGKMEHVRLTDVVWTMTHVNTNSNFWHFCQKKPLGFYCMDRK